VVNTMKHVLAGDAVRRAMGGQVTPSFQRRLTRKLKQVSGSKKYLTAPSRVWGRLVAETGLRQLILAGYSGTMTY